MPLTDSITIHGLLVKVSKASGTYLDEYVRLELVNPSLPTHLLVMLTTWNIEMSQAERLLSYSLLSLITCKPLSSAPMTGISEDEGESNDKVKGLLNSDGAWCWRENCEGERISYDAFRAR